MISLLLVGTAALGSLTAMLFSYRLSDANLRGLNALAAARTVVEQVSTLDFRRLREERPLEVDLPSSSIGFLNVGAWNDRTVDLHGTVDTADDLQISLWLEVTQSNANTLFACSQVVVRFRWQETAFFGTRTREDSLTTVLSNVNSY